MPCRDYEDDHGGYTSSGAAEVEKLRKQNDRLARVACRLGEAMEAGEKTEWLILKGDKASKEAAEWWLKHQAADKAAKEKETRAAIQRAKAAAEKERKMELKRKALSKLSDEELEALHALGLSRKG